MKKFAVQSVLLLLVIGMGLFFYSSGNSLSKFNIPFLPQPPKFATLQINNASLKVEIADNVSKRSKGLAVRQSLGESEGMLFVFERSDKYPFWMKGLKFPLDFVWIKGDKIVDITENVPPPQSGQADSSLTIYSPKVEVDKVLELNAGTVKKLDIKVGDIIKLSPL